MRFRQIPTIPYNPSKQFVSLASMKQALQRTVIQTQHDVPVRTAAFGISQKGLLFTQPIAK